MRKILLTVLLVLLIVLAFLSISKGFTLGKLEIYSVGTVNEKNQLLDEKIENVNKLVDTTYPGKLNELKSANTKMLQAKENYLKLTNVSTNEQILEALNSKSYNIEFLRTSLGNYANSKGVNIKMELVSVGSASKMYNLNFTVDGSYIAIINFVEAIENDTKLNFRINGFKLLPNSESILKATFTVNNVTINGLSGTLTNNPTDLNNRTSLLSSSEQQ